MEKKIVLNTIVSLLKNGVAKFEYRSELSTLNDELKEVHADVGVFKRSENFVPNRLGRRQRHRQLEKIFNKQIHRLFEQIELCSNLEGVGELFGEAFRVDVQFEHFLS